MIASVNTVSPILGPSSATTSSAARTAVDPLATESTFLQLLVTQLKNQDPENPQDGTQFVAQLAQFSSLEQQLGMKQDLDSIKQYLQTGTTNTQQPGAASPAHT